MSHDTCATRARGVTITRAIDDQDLHDCRRFWYDVYVTEMQRHLGEADHTRRELRDPQDETAEVLAARDAQGRVVGTVVTTFGPFSGIDEYLRLYDLEPAPGETVPSITKKLIVSQAYRGGSLAVRLAKATYQSALTQGVPQCVIDCNATRIALFERLGFRLHKNDLDHPDYGRVAVMLLHLLDEQHLTRVRSPFLTILRKHQKDTCHGL